MGSTNSCLLLCDRWTHCVREQGACQLEWVCKISENVQNFFQFLCAKFLTASRLRCSEECVALHSESIETLSVSPE
jgi:hypothetical protein